LNKKQKNNQEENLYKNFQDAVTSRGAEERTFRAIFETVRAYFKAVFKTEQMREYVTSAPKTPVNLITTTSSITDTSI